MRISFVVFLLITQSSFSDTFKPVTKSVEELNAAKVEPEERTIKIHHHHHKIDKKPCEIKKEEPQKN